MILSKFVVLVKVRHSQRMNEALIPIWIITVKDRTINCTHCLGFKAGLAESCSHYASVLLHLEAWTKVNGRLACTQMKCSWILPSFASEIEYARVREINFKSPKKLKVDLFSWFANLLSLGLDFFPEPLFICCRNTLHLTISDPLLSYRAASRSAWSFSAASHLLWPIFWVESSLDRTYPKVLQLSRR